MVERDQRLADVPPQRASFGLPVLALVITVTVFSIAAALGLEGVPNSENGLFYAMGEVAGLDLPDVVVTSRFWSWVAPLAGLGMLASLAAVFVVRKRLGQPGNSA